MKNLWNQPYDTWHCPIQSKIGSNAEHSATGQKSLTRYHPGLSHTRILGEFK